MGKMTNTILSVWLVLVLAVLVVVALPQPECCWYGVPEAGCSRQGGQCIAGAQCEQPLGGPGELCPTQAAKGYQCCAGLPKDERRCKKRGGECQRKGYCKPPALYSAASDCQPDQDCCILLI